MIVLDVRSLILALGVGTISLAFCMFFFISSRKTYPGFSNWTTGFLMLSAGMDDYIPKPVKKEALIKAFAGL